MHPSDMNLELEYIAGRLKGLSEVTSALAKSKGVSVESIRELFFLSKEVLGLVEALKEETEE